MIVSAHLKCPNDRQQPMIGVNAKVVPAGTFSQSRPGA
jgi:hypothetical protein